VDAVTTRQLDGLALQLLERAVAASSISKVADALGYSRPSVSMALSKKYPGDTDKLRARILDALNGRVSCPALSRELSQNECRTYRDRPIPSGPRSAVSQWQTCRHCDANPNRISGGNHADAV